ncbi:hypothetical protein [Parabacteroides timonensis]|uniref:hypothetical protein n=1 Tax=Parabacteroides timonensis TaxID=1871013 RepID=UPI0012B54E07|nr:hypothetical protein [Parabacteroides timonensis]
MQNLILCHPVFSFFVKTDYVNSLKGSGLFLVFDHFPVRNGSLDVDYSEMSNEHRTE